jgi:hypothetical protein
MVTKSMYQLWSTLSTSTVQGIGRQDRQHELGGRSPCYFENDAYARIFHEGLLVAAEAENGDTTAYNYPTSWWYHFCRCNRKQQERDELFVK